MEAHGDASFYRLMSQLQKAGLDIDELHVS